MDKSENNSLFFIDQQMRLCIQRVRRASVFIPATKTISGKIEQGLLVFLGVGHGDTEQGARQMAKKCAELRIFNDATGKMNKSVVDVGGSILVVSQFTLFADCRKGRRPSFAEAANPELADQLYTIFVEAIRALGVHVETGIFRTEMEVELINDGPVTIQIEI
ncbi:MAG: D-aminoacyl-tRNA deacylase [Thermoguttaceae bacterium]